jgi:hypothetical protein
MTKDLAPGNTLVQGTSRGDFSRSAPVAGFGAPGAGSSGSDAGPTSQQPLPGESYPQFKARVEALGTSAGKLAAPSAEDAARLFDVRKDPQFSETENATNVYNSMLNEAKVDSHVSDKALIDGYAKINNPGRAIGVGQYNINADIQSLPDTIKGEVMKAYEGQGVLSTQTRAAMLSLARQRIDQYQVGWQQARGPAVAQAQRMGLDPSRFVPDTPKPNEPNMGEISQYAFDPNTTTLRDKRTGQAVDPDTFKPLQQQPAATGRGGAQSPPAISDQAGYDALPKGSPYIGPDGKQRVKN